MNAQRIATNICSVFGFDGYRDDITPSYFNRIGHTGYYEALTVNVPYGVLNTEIHFYKRTRFFKRPIPLEWGIAREYKEYTILVLGGWVYIIRNQNLILEKEI